MIVIGFAALVAVHCLLSDYDVAEHDRHVSATIGKRPYVADGNSFQVVGNSYEAVLDVTERGDQLELFLTEYFLSAPSQARRPIQVRLIPSQFWPFARSWVTARDPWDNVTVSVELGGESETERIDGAMLRGWLERWAITENTRGHFSVPMWIEWALVASFREYLNPAYRESYTACVEEVGWRSPIEVFEAPEVGWTRPDLRCHAYGISLYFPSGQTRRERFQQLVTLFGLREHRGGAEGTEHSPIAFNGRDWDRWWRVRFEHWTRQPRGAFLTAKESRRIIDRIVEFTIIEDGLEKTGTIVKLTDGILHDARAIAWLENRLQRVQDALSSVHPFYFNTLVSLGQTFEYLLRGDTDRAHQSALMFEDDYMIADAQARFSAELLAQYNELAR